MALDGGAISAIIGGASNLTGQFLNFGASLYAVNNQAVPVGDESNFNIVLPTTQPKSGIGTEVIVLIVVMIVLFLIGAVLVMKMK
jgi:hypothetical protein